MKPLREQGPPVAQRLTEANDAFAPAPGEQAAAWARLRDRLPVARAARDAVDPGPGSLRTRWRGRVRMIFGVGAVAAVVAALWLIIGPGRPHNQPARAAAGASGGSIAAAPRTPAPGVEPGLAPAGEPDVGAGSGGDSDLDGDATSPVDLPLPAGRSVLMVGVRARLAPRGAATVRAGSAASHARVVSLERGTLDMDVYPPARSPAMPATSRASSSKVEVRVAAYRLETEGGRFSVSVQRGQVDLVVHSGKLVVWSSRRVVAQVIAGERWTNVNQREPPSGTVLAPSAVPVTPPAPAVTEAPDCARLTRRGAIDEALTCFTQEAAQPGLVGELALMELARIRRDVKGDLAGAEAALAEHRRRFPHGSLADEAAGARIELLVRLGRVPEGLAESERLAGSEGTFWRGVCLEKLGRPADAARAFDDYLTHPDGKHRAEATKMRQELAP
jgi:hypothetical protein